MVDHGIIDKSDYNNDDINRLLEVNEYLTKPTIVKVDGKKYLIDYQKSDGYNTYAILDNNRIYGICYIDNSVSLYKDGNYYIMNQEKLMKKYNNNEELDEEFNIYEENNNKFLLYSKTLNNGYRIFLRSMANYDDYNLLLNYLYDHLKRPDLIIIIKMYFSLGLFNCYKKKSLDYYDNSYITRGKINISYSLEEMDELLSKLDLPSFIPKDLLGVYLDKDNCIKTLKNVVNEYKKVLKK